MDCGVVERTKMPKLRNGRKGGFEHRLSRLRAWYSTAELPRSTKLDNKSTKRLITWVCKIDWVQSCYNNYLKYNMTVFCPLHDLSNGMAMIFTDHMTRRWPLLATNHFFATFGWFRQQGTHTVHTEIRMSYAQCNNFLMKVQHLWSYSTPAGK